MENNCREIEWQELSIVQQEQLKLKNKQLSECEGLLNKVGDKLDNYKIALLISCTTTILLLIFK